VHAKIGKRRELEDLGGRGEDSYRKRREIITQKAIRLVPSEVNSHGIKPRHMPRGIPRYMPH